MFYSHRTLVLFVFGLVAVISAGDQASAEDWTISSAEEWKENIATSQGATFAEGMVSPDGKSASLRTKLKPYPQKRAAKMLVIDQSPIWQNWNPIANIGPANLQDARSCSPLVQGTTGYLVDTGDPGQQQRKTTQNFGRRRLRWRAMTCRSRRPPSPISSMLPVASSLVEGAITPGKVMT